MLKKKSIHLCLFIFWGICSSKTEDSHLNTLYDRILKDDYFSDPALFKRHVVDFCESLKNVPRTPADSPWHTRHTFAVEIYESLFLFKLITDILSKSEQVINHLDQNHHLSSEEKTWFQQSFQEKNEYWQSKGGIFIERLKNGFRKTIKTEHCVAVKSTWGGWGLSVVSSAGRKASRWYSEGKVYDDTTDYVFERSVYCNHRSAYKDKHLFYAYLYDAPDQLATIGWTKKYLSSFLAIKDRAYF